MTHLNKKRAGDENIGKLIMFSITIIIAVGLVGLITFFYNQSRENAVAGSVLGSSASTLEEIDQAITNLTNTSNKCTGSGTTFTYSAISGIYKLESADTTCYAGLNDDAFKKVIKDVTGSGSTTVTYKMK